LRTAIFYLRQRLLETVYRLFPDPEAAPLAGVLLGVEGGIPQAVTQAFQRAGTAHVIVISGFNFAIVDGLIALLFGRWLGRWRGMLAAFCGMVLYAALAGAVWWCAPRGWVAWGCSPPGSA
jgi:competence protein ComEC